MATEKLTDKQAIFCKEYLIDLNATQAAIRAGYSESTANRIGPENLSKPVIQQEIKQLMNDRAEKIEISSREVLKFLKEIVFADITQTIDLPITMIKQLPREVRQLIVSYKSYSNEFGTNVELKFIDKIRALDMINKHIGFYEKDNEQSKANVKQVFKIGDQEIEFN